MRYLKGTLDYGLRYVTDHEFGLYGYSDSDWADSIPDWKNTEEYFDILLQSRLQYGFMEQQEAVVCSTQYG
jgi:hypothetical protein